MQHPNFHLRFLVSFVRFLAMGILLGGLLAACQQQYGVSINNQPVYGPAGVARAEALDASLQGCINIALDQQNLMDSSELTVLSCANSEITRLDNISQLDNLRFLDLAGNEISNIAPLERVQALSAINLKDNQINDISPLLDMPGLVSVRLVGNDNIPCGQLEELTERLGGNLEAPVSCQN
ncbi:MAG: leucine-rich repeat domain-containing protein [Pseudohongiellaceae bacterium]